MKLEDRAEEIMQNEEQRGKGKGNMKKRIRYMANIKRRSKKFNPGQWKQ